MKKNLSLIFSKEVEKLLLLIHEDIEYIFVGWRFKRWNAISFKRTKWCMWPESIMYLFTQFGKEAALYAGLKQAKGDYKRSNGTRLSGSRVISSNEIYTRWRWRYWLCRYYRKDRKWENCSICKIIYRIINKISQLNIVDGARDFSDASCQMVEGYWSYLNIIVSLKVSLLNKI